MLRPDGTLKTGYTPTGGENQTWDIDVQNSQLSEQPELDFSLPPPQYDFQRQAHVPSTTSFGGVKQGSTSSASSGGRRRLGCMQRVFHAQLVEHQKLLLLLHRGQSVAIGGWLNDSLGNDHGRVDQLDDDDGFGTVRLKSMVPKTGVAHQYKNATSERELYVRELG
ncbi:hypothetical protein LTR17_027114 [Elasticomyces elasticus]|nr:hypothetical protein LTR17_027114 [Elasticomyces elasticus]